MIMSIYIGSLCVHCLILKISLSLSYVYLHDLIYVNQLWLINNCMNVTFVCIASSFFWKYEDYMMSLQLLNKNMFMQLLKKNMKYIFY